LNVQVAGSWWVSSRLCRLCRLDRFLATSDVTLVPIRL
jgi:hypothetical protein